MFSSVQNNNSSVNKLQMTDCKSPCQTILENGSCSCEESNTLQIINEFNEKYQEKINLVNKDANGSLELKNEILSEWIRDLTEQNIMFIETIEELEREACQRVSLLEQRLQVSDVTYKTSLEKKLEIEEKNTNNLIRKDVKGLLEVIRRAKEEDRWSADDIDFYELTPEDIFGLNYEQAALESAHSEVRPIHRSHSISSTLLQFVDLTHSPCINCTFTYLEGRFWRSIDRFSIHMHVLLDL